jgi:hypothetical protein
MTAEYRLTLQAIARRRWDERVVHFAQPSERIQIIDLGSGKALYQQNADQFFAVAILDRWSTCEGWLFLHRLIEGVTREMRCCTWLEQLSRDVQYGLRGMRRNQDLL